LRSALTFFPTFAEIRNRAPTDAAIRHCMQSNGTLINEAWCQFIKEQSIYRFFADLNISQIGFNIEEIEAQNVSSSLNDSEKSASDIKLFMETIFSLQKADQGRMRIREFDDALTKIQNRESLRSFDFPYFNEQVRPFGILNVSCDGDFSTYSPELLGMNLPKYGVFNFGNVFAE